MENGIKIEPKLFKLAQSQQVNQTLTILHGMQTFFQLGGIPEKINFYLSQILVRAVNLFSITQLPILTYHSIFFALWIILSSSVQHLKLHKQSLKEYIRKIIKKIQRHLQLVNWL